MIVRNYLKSARASFGYSQQDVADKLGVNIGSYTSWETQQRIPNGATCYKIGQVLNLDLNIFCEKLHKLKLEREL